MNNTIPNVPRELLERAATSIEQRMCIQCEGVPCCMPESLNTLSDIRALLSTPSPANHVEDVRAMVAAPSPAGVDGLNTDRNAAFKACPESGCDWGSFYLGWKARGEVEQAIIDGLRGEVAQLQSMLATVSKAGIRVRTDRDQQAQRIGELEGLLREWRRMFDGGLESGQLGVLRGHTDTALSAGKEGE